MHIRRGWLREVCSHIFTIYYMINAEQADEKVRKVRSVITLDHLRNSWNKQVDSPLLNFSARLVRPRHMRYQPRAIRIPRPAGSSSSEPVHAWLYFDGPVAALKRQTKLILNFHGGGFVAMSPRAHDDALMAWAGKTRLPLLSVDYRKAPEYPYPYALHECFDVYRSLVSTRGRCVGFGGDIPPRLVLCGDSAGGNLAAAVTLMVLQATDPDMPRRRADEKLPLPEGLMLVYPSLDVNIGNWMSDEQMAMIADRGMRSTNVRVLQRKNSEYQRTAPHTPLPMSAAAATPPTENLGSPRANANGPGAAAEKTKSTSSVLPKSRLAVPSLISYVSDRILTPEMMRAMIILYVGPHARPDFATDFLLSPVRAPDSLLSRFPPVRFLTGERDPLVDDTVIMAARLRTAQRIAFEDRRATGRLTRAERRQGFEPRAAADVALVPGVSHGFMQMAALFPDARRHIDRVAGWLEGLFAAADQRAATALLRAQARRGRARPADVLVGDDPEHDDEPDDARRAFATAASSEDEALEIGGLRRLSRAAPASVATPLEKGRSESPRGTTTLDGAGTVIASPTMEKHADENSGSRPALRASRSSVSLASEDDFLGRRMRGLVGGLTRTVDDDVA